MSHEQGHHQSSSTHLNLLPKLKATSSEKIPKSTESQPVIINFYSANSSQKSDKLVQTDFLPEIQSERKTPKYCFLARTDLTISEFNLENEEEEGPHDFVKNSNTFVADDTTEAGLMEHRKHLDKLAVHKAQTDLERKKLEAELKAAEEIAKLKQTIIEKRLAVELATINEDASGQHKSKSGPQPHPAEILALEDMAVRKQSLMENNLAQDMDNLDFPSRFMASRSPPQGSSRFVNPSSTGLATSRPPPEQRYDPRERHHHPPDQRYDTRDRHLLEQRYDLRDRPPSRKDERATLERHHRQESEYPYYPESHMKTPSIWRSAMAKIKKKMKSKSSQEKWSD